MNEIYLYKKKKNIPKSLNIGLSYPSTYYYGMSVLGYLSLFKDFDLNENVCAQRIFLNSKDIAFNPKHFDILGFSCVFELDILQILKILKKYRFKLFASERKKKNPLIFAGGPVITSNPEPFAEFFDFMIIGDGEGIADEIVKVYSENKNKNKTDILKALSKIKGIYVPSLYKVRYNKHKVSAFYPIDDEVTRFVKKRTSSSDKCLFSPIISDNTFYSNTIFVEIARGCPYECKFCTAHFHNKPIRYFDFNYIKRVIKRTIKYAKKIVFIGAMISSHPDFEELCLYLQKLKEKYDFEVEFSSMSFDFLSPYVPDLITDKTVSLSVEAGSEYLREKINKKLSDKQIFDTIEFYKNKGITKFNLYYMIGLPDESDDDINKYIDFSINMAKTFEGIKFNHIISTFTPKPFTPFEQERKECTFTLNEKLDKIKQNFSENNISYSVPYVKKDALNALVSLGDRRLAFYLKYLFDNNIPLKDSFVAYKKFMKQYNHNKIETDKIPHYSSYIYRKKKEEELLPWEFIKF